MTHDERSQLFREMRDIADPEERKRSKVRERLIVDSLPLVKWTMKRFFDHRGTTVFKPYDEDMMAEGRLGLIEAVDNYDPDSGYKFSTYAPIAIRRRMRDCFVRAKSPLKLSKVAVNVLSNSDPGKASKRPKLGGGQVLSDKAASDAMTAFTPALSVGLLIWQVNPAVPCRVRAAFDAADEAEYARRAVAAALPELEERELMAVKYRYGMDGAVPDPKGSSYRPGGFNSRALLCHWHLKALRKLREVIDEKEAALVA